jgi:serine/threonine-protein kinase HipA
MINKQNKEIEVWADWQNLVGAKLIGILSTTLVRGKEIFAFAYHSDWLNAPEVYYLDPDLQWFKGRQYLQDEKQNFGMFLDSSPDRWGRVLMQRREALMAKRENRSVKTLNESDYLLGVYDPYRMGALRFRLQPHATFLNNDKTLAAPPWASIRELEYASLQIENEQYSDEEHLKWLNMLLVPGSSLGGARPKAGITDENGHLWIAKFPSMNDYKDVGAWECVLNRLAQKAGIEVPEVKAIALSGKHHTFLTKRFDRTSDQKRIHFASAMTLLGHRDGSDFTTGISYMEIAEFILAFGAQPDKDLTELWKRIVFNICVSNTDDHLRNHGFILTEKGWVLSPAYDMNPVESRGGLTLNITDNDNAQDLGLALETAVYYRLSSVKAQKMLQEVKAAVKTWRKEAELIGISRQQIHYMEPAFQDCL